MLNITLEFLAKLRELPDLPLLPPEIYQSTMSAIHISSLFLTFASQINEPKPVKAMKPLFPVRITSPNKKSINLNAVFDSGSFYTIIRTDRLPTGAMIIPEKIIFRTANKKGKLSIQGHTILKILIGKKMIQESVLVSDELGSDMLIGSGCMQLWDISILNSNGKTKIEVAHDMRDPEITEVD